MCIVYTITMTKVNVKKKQANLALERYAQMVCGSSLTLQVIMYTHSCTLAILLLVVVLLLPLFIHVFPIPFFRPKSKGVLLYLMSSVN